MKKFFVKSNILVFIVDDTIIKESVNLEDAFLDIYRYMEFNKIHFVIPSSKDKCITKDMVYNTLEFIDYMIINFNISIKKIVFDFNMNSLYAVKNALATYPGVKHNWKNEYYLRVFENNRVYMCINNTQCLEFRDINRGTLIKINDNIKIIKIIMTPDNSNTDRGNNNDPR